MVIAVATGLSVSDSMGRMTTHVQRLDELEVEVESEKDTWWYTTNNGSPAQKCVETVRKEDETKEAFVARHEARVEARQEKCPPIPPPE